MNWNRIALVANIIKALTPFIFRLVDDVIDAKKKDSDGGKKITKSERQEIIMEHVIDFPQIIELIVSELDE
jgi:hypothetical protein